MSQLDPGARLYPRFSLWDVRDVEGHVRATLEQALRIKNARLNRDLKDKFVTSLVELCWKLSGLEQDGRSLRYEHFAEILVVGRRKAFAIGPYRSEQTVQDAVTRWRERNLPPGAFSFVGYRAQRPKGAYDPSRGLSFSTYSRRIITPRVIDCFRENLGDSRYGDKPQELSLDQLLDEHEATTLLDVYSPGARADFIDQLNPHAYYDPFADIDTAATIGLTEGTEHAAAVG